MRLCIILIAVSALWPVASGLPGESVDSDLSVEVSGVRIVGKGVADDESMRAFNWSPGTTVALLITAPKGGLIKFDSKSSTVTRFVDGKGNDLLAKPANEQMTTGGIGFSSFPKVSSTGKNCSIEVNSPNLPAKGSPRLELSGVISVLCATQMKEEVQKNVPLANGSKLAIADLDLSIDNVGKPEFGDAALGLTLRSSRELDDVAEIRFFKADGSEIKSKRMGTSRMEMLSTRTIEWNYNLAEKADAATVKVFLWTDAQKKKVNFKLNVDVGM